MPLPLSGLLVVSLEQAVAAPMCTCRLADAGARVIKVERPEGDFARYYDKLAVPREIMAAKPAATESLATRSERAAPASPPPFTAELGFTRVRPRIDWPKSDKSDFGLEGQGGGMQQDSLEPAHPLPTPPPQAGEGAHRALGEDAQRTGESAYFVWLNRGKESLVLDL